MKKGFTLLELLTVIVILAIISLIAIPIIANIVEKSKENSAVNSAYGYIHAIKDGITLREVKNGVVPKDKEYDNLRAFEKKYNINAKGNLPTSGKFTLEDSKVVNAELIINGYLIKCIKGVCTSHGKVEIVVITFEPDGGTLAKTEVAIQKGKTVELVDPVKTGYTFNDWYDEDNHKITSETTFDKDTTLHATYTINKYTITLENAKFSDNSTSKQINYGEEVQISAVIPSGYTDSNYVGQTSCSSDSDIGNIKYRINHGYTLESWNITDSLENQITYKVPAKDQTVIATIKEAELITDRQECYSYGASYSSGYYYCPNGGTRSGSTCTKTSTYNAYDRIEYGCSSSDYYFSAGPPMQCINSIILSESTKSKCNSTKNSYKSSGWNCPNDCTKYNDMTGTGYDTKCYKTAGYITTTIYFCLIDDSLSGQTCTKTETYDASYSSGYYYCSSGGSRSGSTCYTTRSIN